MKEEAVGTEKQKEIALSINLNWQNTIQNGIKSNPQISSKRQLSKRKPEAGNDGKSRTFKRRDKERLPFPKHLSKHNKSKLGYGNTAGSESGERRKLGFDFSVRAYPWLRYIYTNVYI